jgi:hypothetical protein
MNLEHARKINTAACFVWMFQQGIRAELHKDHIATIQNATVGQIQTASDTIEAENAEAPSIDGKRHFSTIPTQGVCDDAAEIMNPTPRTTQVACCFDGRDLFEEESVFVEIIHDAGIETVQIRPSDGRKDKVIIEPDMWPQIRSAINRMVSECNKK